MVALTTCLYRAENVLELDCKAPLLILFAAVKRHTVTMLVKTHEREAQIGLPGVALGIQLDQWAADEAS